MADSVIFGPGFWGPIVATASMLFLAGVGYLFILLGHRITPPKPNPEKLTSYACGENISPEQARPDAENFFSPIRRVFGPFYKHVQRRHTGELSLYLWWVVIGLLIVAAWTAHALEVF